MAEGDRLQAIVAAWLAMVRGPGSKGLRDILDQEVVWQGLSPELVCHDRRQVMGLLDRYRGAPPRITRVEAQELGDRVAICLEGPDFPRTDAEAGLTPRSLVVTFRGVRLTGIESFPSPDAAFAALAGSTRHER